ncbi:hypothetical protein GCM10027168_44730 [Streptomyces capparidis]
MARIRTWIDPCHADGTACTHKIGPSGAPRDPASGCTGRRAYQVQCSQHRPLATRTACASWPNPPRPSTAASTRLPGCTDGCLPLPARPRGAESRTAHPDAGRVPHRDRQPPAASPQLPFHHPRPR